MQLPDEYQNDPQGRDKWLERENMSLTFEHFLSFFLWFHISYDYNFLLVIEKIFSVNSYFYHSR